MGRAVCPANEGIETAEHPAHPTHQPPRRAVCPANEGIETHGNIRVDVVHIERVARSAPLMRGLKLAGHVVRYVVRGAFCRAVCPANEGIETQDILPHSPLDTPVARSAPLMRGLKQEGFLRFSQLHDLVARSAPLMRGLKPEPAGPFKMMFLRCRAVCPANEGIETM